MKSLNDYKEKQAELLNSYTAEEILLILLNECFYLDCNNNVSWSFNECFDLPSDKPELCELLSNFWKERKNNDISN